MAAHSVLTDKGWESLDDNCYLCGKFCHPIDSLVGRFYPKMEKLQQVHHDCLIKRG